jgi:hypothetical protein
LAGIIAFLDQNSVGTGGKLVLFCFDDKTYDEVEAELENFWNLSGKVSSEACEKALTDVYKRLRKESSHCIFAEITLDSIWNVVTRMPVRKVERK